MKSTKKILGAVFSASVLIYGAPAFAQECSSGFCGTPDQSGGGCGCGCGCSVLIAQTDMGETYSTSDDSDNDGFEDQFDNCPFIPNTDQLDSDGDGAGEACDNAPGASNPDQLDTDGDGIGDIADDDRDGDGLSNINDNCPLVYNPFLDATTNAQRDTDGDSMGDACDLDDDNDGFNDAEDACPKIVGTEALGATCDADEDGDGFADALDNCPGRHNPDQINSDSDLLGDACDTDMDNDDILNGRDNAPLVFNPDQADEDRDQIGDVIDSEFCYVYFRSDATPCLNPLDTFKVGALAAINNANGPLAGSDINLIMYANRKDTAINYSWVLSKRPSGSSAAIINPIGDASRSGGGFEYRYDATAPMFTADVPGDYELRLEARLLNDDTVFPGGPASAIATFPLTISGDAESSDSGCSATGAQNSLWASLGAAFVGMLLLRRRRRS